MAAVDTVSPPAAPDHAAQPGGGDPPPIDPSQLLLGLPDLAAQCLVGQLGSSALVALMRASRGSRALVVAHAAKVTYKLGAEGSSSRMSRAALHALGRRPGGGLKLVIMFSGRNQGAQLAELLTAAAAQGGWRAVGTLLLLDLRHCRQDSALFSRLVGPACPGLTSLVLTGSPGVSGTIEPALFASLAACPGLTHLELHQLDLGPVSQQEAQQLPQHVPGLVSLECTHLPHANALANISALAGQLTSLTWDCMDGDPTSPFTEGWQAALAACTRLVEVRLGTVGGRVWLDVLLSLPELKRVEVRYVWGSLAPDGPGSAPDTSCSWDSLVVENSVSVQQLPWLPLRGLHRLRLGGLELSADSGEEDQEDDPAALRTAVERTVSALLPLAQRGALEWSDGCPCFWIEALQPLAEAAAPLARLAEFIPGGAWLRVIGAGLVTGTQLAQLLASLGALRVTKLFLSDTTLGDGFWGALQQASLSEVQLDEYGELDIIDFTLWLATHPHPMRLVLASTPRVVADAVRDVQQQLAQQGVVSRVQLVVGRGYDKGDQLA